MSKVICDICGSSYPETSTQCPICGCVKPAQTSAVEDSDQQSGGYTYVKGGRFSKANVRKRNQGVPLKKVTTGGEEDKPTNKKAIALIAVLVCLILIVGSMIGFIAITLIGQFGGGESDDNITNVPCTELVLTKSDDIIFTEPGAKVKLEASCLPADTTDTLRFSSSDEKVATVDTLGNVTCVGEGEAVISVICGEKIVKVKVSYVPAEPVTTPPTETEPVEKAYVKLDREFIDEANFEGFTWPLYSEGSIGKTEINWVSENPAVATVDAEGKVCAVGEGTTVIRAEYQGEVLATCTIVCNFGQETDNPQEGGDEGTAGNYVVYCHYGNSLPFEEDKDAYSATLDHQINEWIGLYLKDPENPDNTVEVVWEIVEGECELDSDGAGLTATVAATCKLKATYNGKTYYLVIY